ncbi:MAG: PQQ-binding-like beta-propeller repeat protein, partial [Tepidisphaerales bacterium]
MKYWNRSLVTLAAGFVLAGTVLGADWPTNRASSERTGNIDKKPGPTAGKVLWVYEGQEHYLASPVIAGDKLIVSGLGAFNTAALHALSLDPAANPRVVWSKKAPYLKQPVVCAPAVVGDRMIFGDGMHQTDGGSLHCIKLNGTPIWQFPVPGALVHLEGGPTVADGKVFIGGGNAGVICVDLKKVTVDSKEMSSEEIETRNEKLWADMMKKYEEEKKKDPDFAIPPSEDALVRPQPKKLWQAGDGQGGQKQWHVDAAVGVAGDSVLVASAYLDVEKQGDRALFALGTTDGKVKWRVALPHNPWGGPTIAGDTVLVGCSSVRFEPKDIPQAKGQVIAVKLADGSPVWQKDVPGGVLSPVTVAGDLAIFTATDGRIRAWNLKDGGEKWAYDAKAPMFAGVAVASTAVYAGDLKGVVHAVGLADGKPLWTVNLATDPAVKAPGMIYGSPIVHDGKVYVGTSNLESSGQ